MKEIKKILRRMHRVETEFAQKENMPIRSQRLLRMYEGLRQKLTSKVSGMFFLTDAEDISKKVDQLITWFNERRTQRYGRVTQNPVSRTERRKQWRLQTTS